MVKRLFLVAAAVAVSGAWHGAEARHSQHAAHAHAHRSERVSQLSGTSRSCLTARASSLLGRIERQFGPVHIVSTCRPGARIAGTGKRSKHATGEAIDFEAPRGKKAAVVKWLIANHHSGGTMTYRDMSHIHVDVGYHFVALNRPSGH